MGGWTHPVTIVAVTKTHGPDAVEAAIAAGITAVGENRVQEALSKQDALPGAPIEWHLIGTLQRNKAKHAAGRFALIHSVDREDLAQELDRRTPESGTQSILVQVNCSAEPQKGGVEPDALTGLLDALRGHPHLVVRGLMTMAEFTDDPVVQRRTFKLLRTVRTRRKPAAPFARTFDGNVWRLPRGDRGRRHDGQAGNPALRRTPLMTDDVFT